MPADVHLDPDGLRRAAVTARRIADGLDAADPGPSAADVGVGVEHRQERLRESVRRVRDELEMLACEACAAAARTDGADGAVAASLRAVDSSGGFRAPGPITGRG